MNVVEKKKSKFKKEQEENTRKRDHIITNYITKKQNLTYVSIAGKGTSHSRL